MKFQKSPGQAVKMFLALMIVIFIAIIIAYVVIRSAEKAPKLTTPGVDTTPKFVYELTQSDIKFTLQESKNLGSVLKASTSRNPGWQKDVTTTEKFISVTIGAQNKGKENTQQGVWDIGKIVDSDGRVYDSVDYSVSSWLPEPDLCGALLKPEFSPTPCTKIFEVAKASTGLKVQVISSKGSNGKKESSLIDLIIK